jgi:hypothetical protein
VAGYQQDLIVMPDVDRQGHGHAGKNDSVIQGNESQPSHTYC